MAEYYVSNDSTGSPLGSNAYDGLSPTVDGGGVGPWLTISYGAQQLNDGGGDTLWVRAGTYVEKLAWTGSYPKGSSENVITVQNYNSEVVTIAPGGGDFCVVFTDTEYITLRGLVLDGTSITNDGVKITTGSSFASHHIIIQGNEIKNVGTNCILNTGPNNSFLDNTLHNNGLAAGNGHGLYSVYHHATITGNIIYDSVKYGVHQFDSGSQSGINSDNVIAYNHIYSNLVGVLCGSGENNLVYNNLVYNNTLNGITLGHQSADQCAAYNNTCWNNGLIGIAIEWTSGTMIVKNNACWDNGTDVVTKSTGASGATLVDDANSVLDPGFLSETPGNPDFLKIDSDSTNTYNLGVDLSAYVIDDIDGNARPQDLLYDIGAYEHVTAVPDVPPVNTIGNQTAVQSVASPLTGISVADVNADCLTVWLALEDGKGTLSGSTVGTATGTFV